MHVGVPLAATPYTSAMVPVSRDRGSGGPFAPDPCRHDTLAFTLGTLNSVILQGLPAFRMLRRHPSASLNLLVMSPERDLTSVLAEVGPRRLQILELIWDRERTVSEIAAEVPVTMAAVSQHLSKLKTAGLVAFRKEGRRRYYRAIHEAGHPVGGVLADLWGGGSPDQPSRPASVPSPATRQPAQPAPRADTETRDEMGSWYRQGLRGRVVALEAARRELATRSDDATRAIQRIAQSLTRAAFAHHFPEIDAIARELVNAPTETLETRLDRFIGVLRQASVSDDATRVRILLVEDDPVEAHLHQAALSGPNREIVTASDVAAARAVLQAGDVSLVILDLGLPGGDGREILVELSRRPRTAAIPVILITGRTDVATQTEVMSLGADALYAKPIPPAILATRVAMILERTAEIRQLGRIDPLTGLRNRNVFLTDAGQLAQTAARAGVNLSLALVGVEDLGTVNDRHGSETGDRVLTTMSEALRGTFRASDLVARWEGRHFAVLFSNATPEGAGLALGKLRDATDAIRIAMPDASNWALTWSAGVASLSEPEGVDDALARAMRRLQVARRPRMPSIVWTDSTEAERPHTVMVVEDDEVLADLLDHRLRREGFEVVRFADGAEALTALEGTEASAVVLDATLPGAEGFEVLRRLKESPSHADVPVVVLTFGSEHDTSRALRLGANDSIAKPFAVEELVARVARLVSAFETGA